MQASEHANQQDLQNTLKQYEGKIKPKMETRALKGKVYNIALGAHTRSEA